MLLEQNRPREAYRYYNRSLYVYAVAIVGEEIETCEPSVCSLTARGGRVGFPVSGRPAEFL
jgi:hypothetical protein